MCRTDQVLFAKVIIQRNKVHGLLMIWLKEPNRWLVGLWLSWLLHALSDILAWGCLIRADGNAGAGLCTLRADSVLSEDHLCTEPEYRQLCPRSLEKNEEWRRSQAFNPPHSPLPLRLLPQGKGCLSCLDSCLSLLPSQGPSSRK